MTPAEEFERDVHDESSFWRFMERHGVEHTEAMTVVSKDKAGNIKTLAVVLPPEPSSASIVVLDA